MEFYPVWVEFFTDQLGTGSYVALEKRGLHGTYGDSWESVARVTWKLPESIKGSITGMPGLTS